MADLVREWKRAVHDPEVDGLRKRIQELEAGIREFATERCAYCRNGLPLVDDGIYRDMLWHKEGDRLVACNAAAIQIMTGVKVVG